MRLAIELMEDHDASIEDMIDALAYIVGRDRQMYIESSAGQPNLCVLACLDATLLHLENAAMAHHASTK